MASCTLRLGLGIRYAEDLSNEHRISHDVSWSFPPWLQSPAAHSDRLQGVGSAPVAIAALTPRPLGLKVNWGAGVYAFVIGRWPLRDEIPLLSSGALLQWAPSFRDRSLAQQRGSIVELQDRQLSHLMLQ